MNKKWTFIWLTLVFTLFLLLAIFSLHKSNPLLLIGSEIAVSLLYLITIWLINKVMRSMSLISGGINLLREGDFNITMAKTGNVEIDGIIDVYNSMIHRLREERLTVREKNQFLDLLIDSSPLGIIILDFDDKITDINKAAIRCLGLDTGNYNGKTLGQLNSKLANEILKINYDEKRLLVLYDGQKYLARKLFFMDHGFRHPFYFLEEFTEEIKKAEKEAYGKVIRMMAHEVSNTIGSVNSIMTSIKSSPETFVSSQREDIVNMLGIAVQRNYQMNRFMQNFSNVVKLPLPEKGKMDLNESVKLVTESFGFEMKDKNIKVEVNLDPSLPSISADRSQMEQVFTNIIRNSIEAVGSNGNLRISTKTTPVMVIFEDDGPGLSKEINEKIFTPFFSTKPGGQGIGLILVNEILTNHGFSFVFGNRDGRGTEFIIKIGD